MTLSTDPHERREAEDEPELLPQIFLSVEAHSCGFVNLGPALALCEQHHPRLPATFARTFLNGIRSCFRIYDDRDAQEHISFLEESYDPTEDAEALAAMPDRRSILPPCMKGRPLGPRQLQVAAVRIDAEGPCRAAPAGSSRTPSVARGVHLPPLPEAIRELSATAILLSRFFLQSIRQGMRSKRVSTTSDSRCWNLRPNPGR